MERNGMKKVIVSLMMLMMVAVAQGQAGFRPNNSVKDCTEKCGLRCAAEIKPRLIALCFGICMIECMVGPTQNALNCTKTCAKSAVDSNPLADNSAVQGYIDACYGNCKNVM
ncbi:hypothetical protein PTKIN_Ptkin18bG0053400 [Pterospermum kingtungense]